MLLATRKQLRKLRRRLRLGQDIALSGLMNPGNAHNGSSTSLNDRIRGPTLGRVSPNNPRKAQSLGAKYGVTETVEAFQERFLRDLDASLSLRERIKAAHTISEDIKHHSPNVLPVLWTLIRDLTTEDAPLEARNAGFVILKASASHLGLVSADRERLYFIIVTPIHSSEASLQISALNRLTGKGRYLAPFEADLVLFLNVSLDVLFRDAQEARELRFASIPARERSGNGLTNANSTKDLSSKAKELLGEEKSLLGIFYLVADIINHNPKAFHDAQLEILAERAISIASKSKTRVDLHGVVKIIRAITTHTQFPPASLEPCVEVLCAILGMPNIKFEEETWICLYNLLRSSNQLNTREILIEILKGPSDHSTSVRGSLLAIQRIAENGDLDGLLANEVQDLAEGLKEAHTLNEQLKLDVLQTLNILLSNDKLARTIAEADWSILREILNEMVAVRPSGPISEGLDRVRRTVDPSSLLYESILRDHLISRDIKDENVAILQALAERVIVLLRSHWRSLDREKLALIVNFVIHIAQYVPSLWEYVITILLDQDLLRPTDANWMAHLWMLVNSVLLDSSKSEGLRCLVLQSCSDLHPLLQTARVSMNDYAGCLRFTCQNLGAEENLPASVVNCLADLAVQCGPGIDMETFSVLLDTIEYALKLSSLDPTVSTMMPDRAAECLIKLFLRTLPESTSRTSRVYKILISIAAAQKPIRIRLSVMKLLARLRCNSKYLIEVIAIPDSQGLAATLCRTEATALTQGSTQISSNRNSVFEQPQPTRTGRSSVVDIAKTVRSRSATRSVHLKDRFTRQTPPLWMYDGSEQGLPEDPPNRPTLVVYSDASGKDRQNALDLSLWLDVMIDILKTGGDWEIYSYLLVHLPSQLSNRSMFAHNVKQIQLIQSELVLQLKEGSFYEPPTGTGIKKGDVAVCLYHTLTTLMAYHQHFGRRDLDEIVRTFIAGVDKWDRAGKCCIHALALCCHEIPSTIDRQIFGITQNLQQKITRSDLAMDILEFLGALARLPDAYHTYTSIDADKTNKANDENNRKFFQTIFGICVRYLQYARDQRPKLSGDSATTTKLQASRRNASSGDFARTSQSLQSRDLQKDLLEYVYALAYHVITSWFLSIDLSQRAQHVGWMTKELALKDESGKEVMEEQSQVILDMMHRTAYSDLGETKPHQFTGSDVNIFKGMWLVGMSIITVEIPSSGGFGQLTKRQASGTTHSLYRHNTAELPKHHVRPRNESSTHSPQGPSSVYPNHIFLQLVSTLAPMPIPLQPLSLPDDEFTKRVLRNFDLTDTVDGHKAGVIYIGQGQSSEAEILANSHGTDAYDAFLSRLGTKVQLQDASFNTQGLDRQSNTDGTHTYAWRDRVTEIVFHVTTMMPSDMENDAHGVGKKRHIGNDHVKIIFNNSGQLFDFDTFASDMNDVNIVITPEAPARGGKVITAKKMSNEAPTSDQQPSATELFGFYKVQTLCSPNFPQLSPAASPKVVSACALPGFVRQLALSASVFSQVWSNLDEGEYVSSWRTRLREIMRLRTKYANTQTSANVSYPMPVGAHSYVEGDFWTGNLAMGGMAESDSLLPSLDFTRWT
ncbi:Tuberous sclerosis 2-like protein [Mycoblastus sanguinarius]|nr:Tuberous sclerosis 2-like protein [Mycoblastus sanguinarius]